MPVDNSLIPCRIDKPNPFEALFALIYMGVGAFCLIAGLRRMERWEILKSPGKLKERCPGRDKLTGALGKKR